MDTASEKKRFLRVQDIAQELSVSTSHAYKIIKALNQEMEAKGFMVVSGRVNRSFFEKKFCYREKEEN